MIGATTMGPLGSRVGGIFGTALRQKPQQEAQRPGLGTRVLGKGWEDRAAALGGMLMGDTSAVSNYHGMQRQQQMMAEQRAHEQRQASMGRENEWADWLRRQEHERNNPGPTAFQRDNEYLNNLPREERARATANLQLLRPAMTTGPDGRMYPTRPNIPTAPVGGLTIIGDEQEGLPPRANGSAPPMSARTVVTPAQLAALEAERGTEYVQRLLRSGELSISGER